MTTREAPRGLDAFFRPRGVAVIGASRQPGKVGHAVLRNLLFGDGRRDQRERGFQGVVCPVHPEAEEVLGLPACPLAELRGPIDLAVVAIPAPAVPGALDTAARRGVRAAIVVSAGFFEMGPDGRRLGEQVGSVARNTGLRVIGPNCTGIYASESKLSASFFSVLPHPGPITLVSQSGTVAQALVQQSRADAIGLRNVVSLGDKVDVEFPELMRHFGKDEGTRVLALYAESLSDPRAFHLAAREVAGSTPLVVLRAGCTGPGHRAARLYEGLDALGEVTMDSALAYAGIYCTYSLASFLAAIRALGSQPPAAGRRIAIVTNAGGVGVLAADAVARAGLDVVKLRPRTLERLAEVTSNPRGRTNPVDLLGDAGPDKFVGALRVVSSADEVDAILLVLTDQAMTDPLEVAIRVCEFARDQRKPIVVSFAGQVGQQSEYYVERYGIPDYPFPADAVEGLRALVARGAYLRARERRPQVARRRSQRFRAWRG